MPTGNRAAILTAAFYGLLSFLLIAILFQFLKELLPVGGNQVSHNSEAYAAVLVLGMWVQFARPRLHGSRWEWPVTAGAAVLCAALALLLFSKVGEWPSRWATLNETLFGLALAIPYVQPRRRNPRAAVALAVAVFAVIVLFARTQLVTDMAENLAIIALVPLGLDVFDRGILDPDAPDEPARRYGWWAFLLVTPVVLHLLQYQVEVGGWLGDVTRYGVRCYEAFIFLLVFELFFVLGLGRTGRRRAADPVAGARA